MFVSTGSQNGRRQLGINQRIHLWKQIRHSDAIKTFQTRFQAYRASPLGDLDSNRLDTTRYDRSPPPAVVPCGRTMRHRGRRLKWSRPVQTDQMRTQYRHQKTQNTSPLEGIWRGNLRKASSAPLRRSLEASSSSTPSPSPSPSPPHFPLLYFLYLVLDLYKYLFIHLYSIHHLL